jgi:hypothetical protein
MLPLLSSGAARQSPAFRVRPSPSEKQGKPRPRIARNGPGFSLTLARRRVPTHEKP